MDPAVWPHSPRLLQASASQFETPGCSAEHGDTRKPPGDRARAARLNALVNDHFGFVWRLLRRWGWSRDQADDITQDVFVVALRKLESILPGSERTFLYGAALRVAANAHRTRRRRREVPVQSWDEARSSGAPPDTGASTYRETELLDHLLRQLPPELMRVLVLSQIEELNAQEIAAMERIPVGTVASRLRRARAQIKKKLARVQSSEDSGGSTR